MVAGLLVLAINGCSGSGGGSQTPDANTGGPDTSTGCAEVDADGDGISDSREDAPSADSDGDGTADYLDDDSDGDGIRDADEAGTDDACRPPRDSDNDGVPDFRDVDSDGNGIEDGTEPGDDSDGDGIPDAYDLDDDGDGIADVIEVGGDPAAPVDSDGDGTPDFRDIDSDGDLIPDAVEGTSDDDGDGVPSYRDEDSDGDLIPDAVEAGANPGNPSDADGDGIKDYKDTDSDNDGLSDNQEDLNQDGVLDPGESDRFDADSDDDGFPDVVEWAAGTDPRDPSSGLSADDFFFVLPYLGEEQQDDLDFSTDIVKADVFFEVDTTGSMSGTISTLQSSLQTVIVPALVSQVADVALGAGFFRDFPASGFGSPTDLPFVLTQRITTNIAAVQNGINVFTADGGSDIPESGMEALYQVVTGEGVSWSVGTAGAVPKFNPFAGYDPSQGHGLLSGAGFRQGALPIVVHATDATYHEAGDYWSAGIPGAHSRDQAVAAAQAMGARFIGIISSGQDKTALKSIARDTSALVSPRAWGATETQCHTGVNGALEPPELDGLCPLVFSMGSSGSGVDLQVVQGLTALVQFAEFDISGLAVGDPAELPGINTARFITAITPVPPAPPGSTINGDEFEDVQPGQPVQFRVHARNNFIVGQREAQLFLVTIRVMGDGVTVLDQRDVFIVVPAASFIP